MTAVRVDSLTATYFQGPISNTEPTTTADVVTLITGIRDTKGDLKQRILYIRERFNDEDLFACEEAKKQLGYILWSGRFSGRNLGACTDYNGLIIGDIDHVEDAAAVCAKLREQPHIAFTFLSPKGNGVKVGVMTDATRVEQHKAAYATVRNHLATTYGLELDTSGSDVCRACFVSYDPDAWCAETVMPLAVDSSIVIAAAEAKSTAAPVGKIVTGRHAAMILFQAKLAALGALDADGIIAATKNFIFNNFDLSDGRTIPEDEIRRGAEGAIAKFSGGNVVGEILHGIMATAGIKAGTAAAEQQHIPAAEPIEVDEEEPEFAFGMAPGPWPKRLLDPDAWGGTIGSCMRGIMARATRPQPALAVACALNLVGTVVGRQVQGPTGLRTNLYNIGLCRTGGGKESALSFAKALFRSAEIHERFLQPETIASDAAIEKETRARPTGFWPLDEIGGYLQGMVSHNAASHQSNVINILLSLYTKADSYYQGKAYGDVHRETIPIVQPCVNVYGTCNPRDFYEALHNRHLDNGFIPRLMIFETDDHLPPRKKIRPAEIDADLVAWFHAWGTNQTDLARAAEPCPDVVPFGPGAEALFDQFSDLIDDQRRKAPNDEAINSILSRSAEKVLRVALIRAVSRHTPDQVGRCQMTADDIRIASELISYIDARLLHNLGRFLCEAKESSRVNKEMQRFIEDAGAKGRPKSEIRRKFRGQSPKDYEAQMETLQDTGLIVAEFYKPQKGQGSLRYYGKRFAPSWVSAPAQPSQPPAADA